MKLDSYKKLLALGCFGRKQVEALWRENTSKYLDDALKQGLIRRVRKDLYVSVSLETHQPTVNKFEIASHLSPTACVSHHAALEFYGYANQVFYDMTFISQSKVKPFEFDGVSYRQIFSGISEGVSEQNGVRVTDLERSVLDCIDAFEKVCGLEELEACLDMIPSLDEGKLRRYLPLYGKAFLYQKAGYLLEKRQSDLKLSDGFFDFCQKGIASRRSLGKGTALNKRWNLYVKE